MDGSWSTRLVGCWLRWLRWTFGCVGQHSSDSTIGNERTKRDFGLAIDWRDQRRFVKLCCRFNKRHEASHSGSNDDVHDHSAGFHG